MPNQRSQQKQVDQLNKEIAALQFKRELLQKAAKDDQQRADSVRKELEAETTQLLKKRKEAFGEQERVHGLALQGIEDRLKQYEATETKLAQSITAKKQEIIDLDAAIQDKQPEFKRLGVLDAELLEKRGAIIRAIDETSSLNNAKLGLENDIHTLGEKVKDKKEVLEGIESKITTAKADLQAVATEKEALIDEKEAKITLLDRLIYDKRVEYDVFDKQMAQERKDIADRQIALNSQDQNLRIREIKAQQKEDRIQQNAGLLNL